MNLIRDRWPIPGPLEIESNTWATRTGKADPTGFLRDGRIWRASRHSSGAATVAIWRAGSTLHAEAWGDGAEEALSGVPALVGLTDDPSGFDSSRHPVVHDVARSRPGIRLGATRDLFDVGVRAVLGQKVTGLQAKRSFHALVRRCNERAPLGVVSRRPLFLPPTPDALLAALAGHGATTLGIDVSRTAALRQLALVAHHLPSLAHRSPTEARTFLQQIPGIGEWTANEMTVVAMADQDAVSVGDYHLKNIVAFVLTGRPRGTDEEMVELLEPFRPHRARAMQMIALSGLRPPKYGPRMNVPSHVPVARP